MYGYGWWDPDADRRIDVDAEAEGCGRETAMVSVQQRQCLEVAVGVEWGAGGIVIVWVLLVMGAV